MAEGSFVYYHGGVTRIRMREGHCQYKEGFVFASNAGKKEFRIEKLFSHRDTTHSHRFFGDWQILQGTGRGKKNQARARPSEARDNIYRGQSPPHTSPPASIFPFLWPIFLGTAGLRRRPLPPPCLIYSARHNRGRGGKEKGILQHHALPI